jgi:undecaprenyl diphosphate synthase
MKQNNNYHIGIILDGNRRWALEKGVKPYQGHKKGLETARKTIEHAYKRGLTMLTLFVFSTENWKRPKMEVNFLMGLIEEFFNKEFKKNKKSELFQGIKVKVIGQREKFSKKINRIINKIEETTEKNKGMILNIALSYGGRMEIVEVIKKAVKDSLSEKEITEKYVAQNLSIPDMDLIIRTGKEKRLSNFFIWQAAYSELYFMDKYWPEFNEQDFDKALEYYQLRQRRFGK